MHGSLGCPFCPHLFFFPAPEYGQLEEIVQRALENLERAELIDIGSETEVSDGNPSGPQAVATGIASSSRCPGDVHLCSLLPAEGASELAVSRSANRPSQRMAMS